MVINRKCKLLEEKILKLLPCSLFFMTKSKQGVDCTSWMKVFCFEIRPLENRELSVPLQCGWFFGSQGKGHVSGELKSLAGGIKLPSWLRTGFALRSTVALYSCKSDCVPFVLVPALAVLVRCAGVSLWGTSFTAWRNCEQRRMCFPYLHGFLLVGIIGKLLMVCSEAGIFLKSRSSDPRKASFKAPLRSWSDNCWGDIWTKNMVSVEGCFNKVIVQVL